MATATYNSCGNNAFVTLGDSDIVRITSTNYPRNYPNGQYCIWRFKVRERRDYISLLTKSFFFSSKSTEFHQAIRVTIEKLHLQSSNRCHKDYLSTGVRVFLSRVSLCGDK